MRRRMTPVIVMLASIGVLTVGEPIFDELNWGYCNWCGHAWADSDVGGARRFSAELVSSNAAGEAIGVPGKIYVDDSKVRIETPDLPDSFFLIDSSVPATYLVSPQARVFMDAKQSSRLTRLFVPLAADDPCPQWETMAEVAGIPDQSGHWHCAAVDHDNVAGRDTVKFDAISPRGHSAGWIDLKLKFPLKIEIEDGSIFTLQNIQEGPQSADLFVIPAGYKKFDPRLLLERLKHSDVLVEPPN
jgi:hypothetical protein